MICLETKLINPEVSGQDWLYLVQLFLSFSTERANLDNWYSTANSETIGDRISIKAIFYKDFGGHLRKNHQADNYEGYYPIFATAFCRILRVYIYRSLSYMPTCLAPETLWRLCLYAQPELEKMEYLFAKISSDRFFLNLDHYLRFNDHLWYGSVEQLGAMKELLLNIMEKTKILIAQS